MIFCLMILLFCFHSVQYAGNLRIRLYNPVKKPKEVSPQQQNCFKITKNEIAKAAGLKYIIDNTANLNTQSFLCQSSNVKRMLDFIPVDPKNPGESDAIEDDPDINFLGENIFIKRSRAEIQPTNENITASVPLFQSYDLQYQAQELPFQNTNNQEQGFSFPNNNIDASILSLDDMDIDFIKYLQEHCDINDFIFPRNPCCS